ncbi:MAG: hypothetical protein CVU84_05385 [Firmicutes bacterium HGW-Firmicutes-1]|jgi:vacuolar-type H+-ATPase subunit E/Vma4|nr:MAG: hypothetical protein CVU84_05385 [Firmicutes bacterium HGW-Firmicutes-1]
MRIIEEKLERFANDIMKDVAAQKKELLGDIIHANKIEYDKRQTEYLTENYSLIQNSLKKIDKEKNEIMSKVIMDNKMKLLNKRTEVIHTVFQSAKEKLKTHTQSEGYFDELVDTIKKNIEAIGQGEIEIIISYSDEQFLERLKEIFTEQIKIENKNIEMLGGCKVMNKTKRLFIDDSYAKRLEDQKPSFLQRCQIQVEM